MYRAALAGVALVALLAASTTRASAQTAPTTTRDAVGPAAELFVSAMADARTVTVRLEVDLGPRDEPPGQRGATAALLATLVHAPARHPSAPSPRLAERAAGLRLSADLSPDALAVTVSGPAVALETALWAAAERLADAAPAPTTLAAARAGLWDGADAARQGAVTLDGDALDAARRAALGYPGGWSPFASRVRAGRLDAPAFADAVAWARRHARWRLVVVAPTALAARARALALDALAQVAPRRSSPAVSAAPPTPAPWPRPPLNRDDGRHFVLAAWPLALPPSPGPDQRRAQDAALLTLEALLDHPGGLLVEQLVRGHALAREVFAEVTLDGAPALAIAVVLRGSDPADLRRLLVAEVERLTRARVDDAVVSGAARVAARKLALAWARGPDRARLVGTLARSGRLDDGAAPEAWLAAMTRRLSTVDAESVRATLSDALRSDRRVALDLPPETPAPEDRVALDDEQLARYVRIMVDIRCPPPGQSLELIPHLQRKYGLSARDYVVISRAISRRADLMRRLGREADERCLEIAKLRSLASLDTVVALHEALACGPGQQADPQRRAREVARIFRRFDLDESVYRPLLGLAREDVDAAARLAAIDARCAPTFGPAAPDDDR